MDVWNIPHGPSNVCTPHCCPFLFFASLLQSFWPFLSHAIAIFIQVTSQARPPRLSFDVHVRMRACFVISCQVLQERLDVDQAEVSASMRAIFFWESQGGTCEAVSSAHPTQIFPRAWRWGRGRVWERVIRYHASSRTCEDTESDPAQRCVPIRSARQLQRGVQTERRQRFSFNKPEINRRRTGTDYQFKFF